MAAVGLNAAAHAERKVDAEMLQLSRNGWMPNIEHLPVLWYHGAFHAADAASAMEERFGKNGWPPQWRNGVYDFHHFHSTAHEVLGFAAGGALLMLGGEGGRQAKVEAGDVLVLPAGTGHCRISADARFLVVGAYPPGQRWDICRSAPDAAAQERMRALSFPKSDPVGGPSGRLVSAWEL